MTKKITLLFLLAFISIKLVNAQCSPNNIYTKLVTPDTVTNLPADSVSKSYSTNLYTYSPVDTTVSVSGTSYFVTIDTLTLVQINGLPAGLTYQTDQPYWKGGFHGCVNINGTVTNHSLVGTHKLLFIVRIHTTYQYSVIPPISIPFTLKDTLIGYKINVLEPSGVDNKIISKFDLSQNTPNPFKGKTEIIVNSPNSQDVNFNVYNLLGQPVYNEKIKAKSGENKISFNSSNLKSGIYFYQISNGLSTITKKMTID